MLSGGRGSVASRLPAAGSLALGCDELDIDDTQWAQSIPRRSLALDGGGTWCLGRPPYLMPADGDPAGRHYGTPGLPNPPCEQLLDLCVIEAPADRNAAPGADVAVALRVEQLGLTTQTPGVDTHPAVRVQAGWAAVGTQPTDDDDAAGAGWTLVPARPDLAWDGEREEAPDADRYTASFPAPQDAAEYDLAWRVSIDDARTWTWCDAGEGSADGYLPATSGTLTVE